MIDTDGDTFCVQGGQYRPKGDYVSVGSSGTTLYFLTPLAALASAPVTIVGQKYFQRRPIRPLLDALAGLGVRLDSPTGTPPISVTPHRPSGGRVRDCGDAVAVDLGPAAGGAVRDRRQPDRGDGRVQRAVLRRPDDRHDAPVRAAGAGQPGRPVLRRRGKPAAAPGHRPPAARHRLRGVRAGGHRAAPVRRAVRQPAQPHRRRDRPPRGRPAGPGGPDGAADAHRRGHRLRPGQPRRAAAGAGVGGLPHRAGHAAGAERAGQPRRRNQRARQCRARPVEGVRPGGGDAAAQPDGRPASAGRRPAGVHRRRFAQPGGPVGLQRPPGADGAGDRGVPGRRREPADLPERLQDLLSRVSWTR